MTEVMLFFIGMMSGQSTANAESEDGAICGQESAKILLVDDSRDLLDSLSALLEGSGYRVAVADSVETALINLETDIPDLILSDLCMPEVDGVHLLGKVRENPALYSVPFLFLSASTESKQISTANERGCDQFLSKPFDPDELLAIIRGKISLSRQRKKMASQQDDDHRRRIIHTLSHEFRTPLVSINTGTELLLERLDDMSSEQVARLLKSVLRGGQRLERLVDDFMLVQQIDLGHAKSTQETYSTSAPLPEMINQAVMAFSDRVLSEDLCEIEVCPAAGSELKTLRVCVYDVQVINVIERVLQNAYKFGGKDEKITISYGQKDDYCFVGVRDRGPGLEEHARKALNSENAEVFNQINRDVYEQQGCGLGLAIAKYFIGINNGSISLEQPEEGKGLLVMLRIPCEKPSVKK